MEAKISKQKIHKLLISLIRASKLVWQSSPRLTMLSLVYVVALSLLPLVSLYLLKKIIDLITLSASAGSVVLSAQALIIWVGLALAVTILSALFRSLSEVTSQTQALKVTDMVFDLIHTQSIAMDLGYYEDPAYFDTLHRAQQEAPYRPSRILTGLTQVVQNSISLVGVVWVLFSFNPLLGLLLIGAVLPGGLLRMFYAGKTYNLQMKQTASERQAWYYHWMQVDSSHAKELRLFNLGGLFIDRFQKLRKEIREGKLTLLKNRTWVEFLAQVLVYLTIYGVLGLTAYFALQGDLTVGDVTIIFLVYQNAVGYTQSILQGLSGLYEDGLFLNNFYEFLELKPIIQTPTHPRPIPSPFREELTFENVSFRYPNQSNPALENINLNIKPGQVIALVGENGSGKTTLIKLLCRLYQPTSGTIALDGINLGEFDPILWRKEISVVFQDFVHYQLPAKENIWFGNAGFPPEIDPITNAAVSAGIDPVIRRLPLGYDTPLGTWFDDSHELSMGEWQKVALARMFLREANIVVLDEPTGSLDPLAEADLFIRFRELIGQRSAILISHRFTTIQLADRIYALNQGRIVESGSHNELMDLNGYYARMYKTQAKYYANKPDQV